MSLTKTFTKNTSLQDINREWQQLKAQQEACRKEVTYGTPYPPPKYIIKPADDESRAVTVLIRKRAIRTNIIHRVEVGGCTKIEALNSWHAYCKDQGLNPYSDAQDDPKLKRGKVKPAPRNN